MTDNGYLVPDLLYPGVRAVFCGTAPSRKSAEAVSYYAHPQNRFWPALYEAGFLPEPLSHTEHTRLKAYGYGLTDICKTASGNDDQLPEGAFDGAAFREKIRRYRPSSVLFTSKKAASAGLELPYGRIGYGVQETRIEEAEEIVCFVLCSPSPRAIRYWDSDVWRRAAALCGGMFEGRAVV